MRRGPQTLQLPTGATSARIAGFLGHSPDAWPGRKAVTIQIAGCPMSCPYCATPELITTTHRSGATLADILGHIDRTHAEGVVVSGGEPTCDDAIIELLETLRAEGVPVKLDTNGAEPAVLREILARNLVDFVALDVKAIPSRYDAVSGYQGSWPVVTESIRAVIDSGVEHEFRITCYPLAVTLDDISNIARELAGGRRLVLQQFNARRTLDSAAHSVTPYPAAELARAVERCNPFIQTVVRGA